MTDIKECPFCGARGKVISLELTQNENGWFVYCKFCLAQGPGSLDPYDAELKWNRRETK